MMTIWFDMDGTIANLYGVENWLEMLEASDPYPYASAAVMLNMSLLARYLNKLQKLGYQLGIISWLARSCTESYKEAITQAKLNWLAEHLKSVTFDEINIADYGTPKSIFKNNDSDILFDDEERNRTEWGKESYIPDDIMEVLKSLLDSAE